MENLFIKSSTVENVFNNTQENKKKTIPWVEKYRPVQFDEIVLDPYNRRIFNKILEMNYFPNLLFYGPPGTGKTTTIINLIQEYQTKYNRKNKSMIIHLNASDERGIDIIRNQINQFVKSKNLFETGLKFVILEEVDIRSIINFVQLNQNTNIGDWGKNIIHSAIYENLQSMLKNKRNSVPKIIQYLHQLSIQYNIDKKNILQNYFNYIIRNHPELVTPAFLDIVENVVHNYDTKIEYLLSYFCSHLQKNFAIKNKK